MRVILISEQGLDEAIDRAMAKCEQSRARKHGEEVDVALDDLMRAVVYHVEMMRKEIKDRVM